MGVNGQPVEASRATNSMNNGTHSQIPFMVSAPGKVIVFGEHAVVHGKAAIAAAISLRSYLLVTPHHASNPELTLAFPDIKLEHTWSIHELPWSTFSQASKAKRFDERVSLLDEDLKSAIAPHVAVVSPNLPAHARHMHQAAATAFLYVLLSLGSPTMRPTLYTLRSTIPIGAGLGSSASISVCLAMALLHQTSHLDQPLPDQSPDTGVQILDIINHWAFVGELCIHGNPSGVDNTVATKGKAVLFKRTHPGKPPSVTPIHDFPVLPLLLVDTKQSRSTAAEVAKVGSLKHAHPTVTDLMLDAIDKLTESAHTLMSSADFDPKDAASLQRLGELVRVNHGLLVALGVSHPKLERIRELIDHAGIGWTKLTGAGGGGCAITVLKPDVSGDALRGLEKDLEREGFEKYETLLGGVGAGILLPAVGGDRVGEIAQEEFLRAGSSEEVERLVGAGKDGFSEGWRFWTS